MPTKKQTEPAVVLIHGFNGEPADMAYLYDYLTARGMTAYNLKLNGHAGSRKEMRRHGCRSWIAGVLRDVLNISRKHDRLYVVGFSMGGLLAANLQEHFKLEKLVFVNTAVYFWNGPQIWANIRNDLKSGQYSKIRHYLSSSHDVPFVSLLNFLRIVMLSKPKFKKIDVNALILQNKDDDTVQPRSALYIKASVKGPSKLVWFDTGGHMMFVDERKDDAAKAVYEFLALD